MAFNSLFVLIRFDDRATSEGELKELSFIFNSAVSPVTDRDKSFIFDRGGEA